MATKLGYVGSHLGRAQDDLGTARGGLYYRAVGDGSRRDYPVDNRPFFSDDDRDRVLEAMALVDEARASLSKAHALLVGLDLGFFE